MREITIDEMRMLNAKHGAPMLSIYLNKDNGVFEHKTFEERWKDSISKAEFLLLKDFSRSFVSDYLEQVRKIKINEILTATDKGIVVFMSDEKEIFYLCAYTPIHDLTIVADSFHIKPLIKLKKNERGFFFVTISSRAINVYIDNEGHLLRLESYRNDPGVDGTNRREYNEFLQQSAKEMNKLFISHRVPIVLAGVKDNIGHMKKLLSQSFLMTTSIIGNVEKMKTSEMRDKVIEILQPYYIAQELKSQSEIDTAIAKERAVLYLEDIAISAVNGKIKKLFVVENKYLWGSLNWISGEMAIAPKKTNAHDDDILDDLCQIVLSKGGEVEVISELKDFKGQLAVAIVTDTSHLTYSHDGEVSL